ncbi:MAG: hypothetical protein AAFO04_29485, partial [Cyanobacteria bacterium J06592_8]
PITVSGTVSSKKTLSDQNFPFAKQTPNRSFENLDQLEEVLCQRCQTLLKQPELIQGLTSFHWWSQIDDDIITN